MKKSIFLGILGMLVPLASYSQSVEKAEPQTIYVTPSQLAFWEQAIVAFLDGKWIPVTALYPQDPGVYQATIQTDQTSYVQKVAYGKVAVAKEDYPYCFNNHTALYAVRWNSRGKNPDGSDHEENQLYRWLCNYHSCPYEFHDFMRTKMPPNCYWVKR